MDDEDDDSGVELELIPRSNRATELVDPNLSKSAHLENEMDEVKANLMELADLADTSIREAAALAKASQHPDSYEVLAKMLAAAAKVNREAQQVLLGKKILYDSLNKNNDTIVPQTVNVTNNTLTMTTTDMVNLVKKREIDGFRSEE